MILREIPLEELKYPVGRFDPKAPLPTGGREALIVSLAMVPTLLTEMVADLNDQQLDTPYRLDGWTVRQLVHHVPESHLNAYVRMKWGLTEDVPTIKTYDEKRWAEVGDARTAPINLSLDLLSAIHARWDSLLRSMTDSNFARRIKHPEWGELQLLTLLQQYEWHGRHHVAHVQGLRGRMGWGRQVS